MGIDINIVDFKCIPLQSMKLPTLWRGGIPLFDAIGMSVLLAYCEKNIIYFLGIEGFKIEGKYIKSDINWIADFSSTCESIININEHISNVRLFLKNAPPHILFECILMKYRR